MYEEWKKIALKAFSYNLKTIFLANETKIFCYLKIYRQAYDYIVSKELLLFKALHFAPFLHFPKRVQKETYILDPVGPAGAAFLNFPLYFYHFFAMDYWYYQCFNIFDALI